MLGGWVTLSKDPLGSEHKMTQVPKQVDLRLQLRPLENLCPLLLIHIGTAQGFALIQGSSACWELHLVLKLTKEYSPWEDYALTQIF